MLSQKIINKILEIGFYFDDEFDFEKNKIVLTQESRGWFRDNLGLKYLNSAFVDFYSFCSGGCGPNDNAKEVKIGFSLPAIKSSISPQSTS
jgi:hypothetical protein